MSYLARLYECLTEKWLFKFLRIADILRYIYFCNLTDIKGISQGFSEGALV
jgi:hypothetical protein